jgi:hypothetical protein
MAGRELERQARREIVARSRSGTIAIEVGLWRRMIKGSHGQHLDPATPQARTRLGRVPSHYKTAGTIHVEMLDAAPSC